MFSCRALKNLMESMDDRLLVLCHGGLPMMYEVRRSVKSPPHEVTSVKSLNRFNNRCSCFTDRMCPQCSLAICQYCLNLLNDLCLLFSLQAFNTLHMMYHEATACHVTGDLADLLSLILQVLKVARHILADRKSKFEVTLNLLFD